MPATTLLETYAKRLRIHQGDKPSAQGDIRPAIAVHFPGTDS